ncbi:MAG: hypothetical protein Q4E68_03555 [Prevotellaceae bacterium]|nr:hypothetical protein [Prevotellaceae bacterium]
MNKKIFIALMLGAASLSVWAGKSNLTDVNSPVEVVSAMQETSYVKYDYDKMFQVNGKPTSITISADENCNLTLTQILNQAGITSSTVFDYVKIEGLSYSKIGNAIANLNTYTLDMSGVVGMTEVKDLKNSYVWNVILPTSIGQIDKNKIAFFKKNFNLDILHNIIVAEKDNQGRVSLDAYVNKPGFLANGLQYVSELTPYSNGYLAPWYNDDNRHDGKGYGYNAQNISKVKISGYVFARDIKGSYKHVLDAEGHMVPGQGEYQGITYPVGSCECELAPSHLNSNQIVKDDYNHEINVHVNYSKSTAINADQAALLGANNISSFDFTDAEFGYYDNNGVFQYYPADMTISEFYYLGNGTEILKEIKLPTSATQFIIPEGFMHDSKNIKSICLPYNYTEYHRYAFLNGTNGLTHYTTIAAKDEEQYEVAKGGIVDRGDSTMILPSTTAFVGRGAFSGYGGKAKIKDVYVLAEKAPVCEFYAFDQASYCGENGHFQRHQISKGNYVNDTHGFVMLHFPYECTQQEMLNYSDMTRKYRLYDETGKFNNVGDILVWPSQAQYNRSFNQALAGVTWDAWKHSTKNEGQQGYDDPENAYSGYWYVGSGEKNATHEIMLKKVASEAGWSEDWRDTYTNGPFDFSQGKTLTQSDIDQLDSYLASSQYMTNPTDWNDRPLVYDWKRYGGWHQFAIAELYDFLLTPQDGDPREFYNFAKYDKNIWYSVCFPFNMTKAQVLEAFGDPTTNEYPFVSTLAGVTRESENLKITITMSKNLLKNKLIYEEDENGNETTTVKCDKSTGFQPSYIKRTLGDDEFVIEADKPYFILPCIPQSEFDKIADQIAAGKYPYRRCEVTKPELAPDEITFPIPTNVHAVNGTHTAYVGYADEPSDDVSNVLDYYFVGNYIPQQMPENAYYLYPYKKNDGSYWSSFYRNNPVKTNFMWNEYTAIVMAVLNSNTSGGGKGDRFDSEDGNGYLIKEQEESWNETTRNYVWKASGKDDFVFFEGTSRQKYSTMNMSRPDDDEEATMIMTPNAVSISTSDKVYNINGQFVGLDKNNLPKGFYIVGGKKVVVK